MKKLTDRHLCNVVYVPAFLVGFVAVACFSVPFYVGVLIVALIVSVAMAVLP